MSASGIYDLAFVLDAFPCGMEMLQKCSVGAGKAAADEDFRKIEIKFSENE